MCVEPLATPVPKFTSLEAFLGLYSFVMLCILYHPIANWAGLCFQYGTYSTVSRCPLVVLYCTDVLDHWGAVLHIWRHPTLAPAARLGQYGAVGRDLWYASQLYSSSLGDD